MPPLDMEFEKVKEEAKGTLETVSTEYNMELLEEKMKQAAEAYGNGAKMTAVMHLEEMEKIINRTKEFLVQESKTNF